MGLFDSFAAVYDPKGSNHAKTFAFSIFSEDSDLLDELVEVFNAARPAGSKRVNRSGVIRYLIRQNAPAILKAWNSE